MFKLLSKIIEDDQIQLSVEYNGIIVCNKFLNMDINGDGHPTFANSRLIYNEITLTSFIENMKSNTQNMFMFDYDDEEEIFDGFMYNDGKYNGDESIIIKTSSGKLNMSINISLKDCKERIISDLMVLKENINDIFITKTEYLSHIAGDDDFETLNEDKTLNITNEESTS